VVGERPQNATSNWEQPVTVSNPSKLRRKRFSRDDPIQRCPKQVQAEPRPIGEDCSALEGDYTQALAIVAFGAGSRLCRFAHIHGFGPETDRLRVYPQIVAPVSRPAVLAASKPPGEVSAGLSAAADARQPLWRAALQIRNLRISPNSASTPAVPRRLPPGQLSSGHRGWQTRRGI